jgi:hypothetical protein
MGLIADPLVSATKATLIEIMTQNQEFDATGN